MPHTKLEYSLNPFTDTESIYNTQRRAKLFIIKKDLTPITPAPLPKDECYCDFCMGNIDQSTPSKRTASWENGVIVYHEYPDMEDSLDRDVLFRVQGNLFEIIGLDYWREKYGINLTESEQKIAIELYRKHKAYIKHLLSIKKEKLGSVQTKEDSDAFIGGFHELLTSGRHYLKGADSKDKIFHSGAISAEEHRTAYNMVIQRIKAMKERNPYIKFVCVFQNWLHGAGASFEHWHKQILGIDFWGRNLERERGLYQKNKSAYMDFVNERKDELFLYENKFAVSYIEQGAKSCRIVICSKSKHLRPHEHSAEEINAVSDMVHEILGVIPNSTPYNEEWYYTPFDAEDFKTPWRVAITIRSGVSAGFENITGILINPLSLKECAELFRHLLKKEKKISKTTLSYCK